MRELGMREAGFGAASRRNGDRPDGPQGRSPVRKTRRNGRAFGLARDRPGRVTAAGGVIRATGVWLASRLSSAASNSSGGRYPPSTVPSRPIIGVPSRPARWPRAACPRPLSQPPGQWAVVLASVSASAGPASTTPRPSCRSPAAMPARGRPGFDRDPGLVVMAICEWNLRQKPHSTSVNTTTACLHWARRTRAWSWIGDAREQPAAHPGEHLSPTSFAGQVESEPCM